MHDVALVDLQEQVEALDVLCSLFLLQKDISEAEKAAAEMRPGKQDKLTAACFSCSDSRHGKTRVSVCPSGKFKGSVWQS